MRVTVAVFAITACAAPEDDLAQLESAVEIANCNLAGACPQLLPRGDGEVAIGPFHGFADPTLLRDPFQLDRIWLAYSWPHVRGNVVPGVLMPAVDTHLAVSDNGGATFTFLGALWSSVALDDPEGSGKRGLYNSETPSLATIAWGPTTRMWYGARLSYFMEPTGTYSPKYATSYVVRIAAASSLEGLANAPEAVLGVRSTALVYGPNERLDRLAGVPLQDCAMVNDPALFAQGTTLYLIASCLAFSGEREDFTRTTQRVFATRPLGPPAEWTWRHVGVLATHEVAVELGDDTIVQPVISRAADGTLLYITAIAHDEPDGVTGVTGDGCRALELSSLDPPVLRRDAAGRLVIRAAIQGTGVASCAHDPWSASGMLAHDKGVPNGPWILRLRP